MKQKFLEFLRKTLTKAAVKQLFVFLIKKAISIPAGLGGWLIGIVIGRLVSWGLMKARHEIIEEQVEEKNEQITEHYETVINNPNSTPEQVELATDAFLGVRVRRSTKGNTKRP